MRAMTLNTYGEIAPFEAADLPEPEVAPGHVLVRVAATSVNTVDTMIRNMGTDLPFAPAFPAVLGMDFAGTVEAVGDGVTDFAPGDEVYGCAGGLADLQGALAEKIVADARLVAPKPASLTMREAAALPLVGITAHEALSRAGLSGGQTVLIQGGSGGVGHVAVQLARHMGAEVVATDTGGARLAAIDGLGATAVDFKAADTADIVARHTGGTGFDVVFDTVGGANLPRSFEAAKLNGHVATTVALEAVDLSGAHFRGLSLHVVFMLIPMLHNVGRAAHGEILRDLARIADAGALRPILDDTAFTLDEIGAAQDRLTGGDAIGKVVVTV
ncbi:zinc-dependent alcohol dehydrogenase family protein [uncultured Jannaschia sp.]|uniref:zinc-dependent alcohol dehydrogenase family protein n=1 Tax=uncultured Jannaschia sp. TaxID=293347 RepID=UPI00260554DD|nr:zinc-dependent alcohol dehydrogenase family protein [uncultured Jannaschia sp.]